MKKFYHVSLDLSLGTNTIFTPRIPDEQIRMDGEEGTIPRICVSSTIEGCLSAVPFGGRTLFETKNLIGLSCPINVLVFDEKDILNGNLISPEELYKKDWVRDAFYTDEYWIINQSIKPIESFGMVISEFNAVKYDDISYENREKSKSDLGSWFKEGTVTIIEELYYEIVKEYTKTDNLEIILHKNLDKKDLDKLYDYFKRLCYADNDNFRHRVKKIEFIHPDKSITLYDSSLNLSNDKNIIKVLYEAELNLSIIHIRKKLEEMGFKIYSISTS